MSKNNNKNTYDDENIPKVYLPQDTFQNSAKAKDSVEPLPESFRPRKDGPGGE